MNTTSAMDGATNTTTAERAVIGAMIVDCAVIHNVQAIVGRADFASEAHGQLFDIIGRLYDDQGAVDCVTLEATLARDGTLERIGGTATIAGMAEEAAPAFVAHHAQVVRDASQRRRAILAAQDALHRLRNTDANPADVLAALADTGADPGTSGPQIVSVRQLRRDHPDRRPVVIEGLLRRGETLTIVASPKSHKSWLALGLAEAVCSGRPWLGMTTSAGPVLMIDAELHDEELSHRSGVVLGDQPPANLDILRVRGEDYDIHAVGRRLRAMKPGQYRLIVLDALYRFYPPGVNENDNAHMTAIYNALDRHARRLEAAIIVIHHASKGNQADKGVTDVGSGAGAMGRAADCHMVLRQHEEEDAAVAQAVVRSFPPLSPIGLRWAFPRWTVDTSLDTGALKGKANAGGRPPKPQAMTAFEFARDIVGYAGGTRETIVARAQTHGLSIAEAGRLMKAAEHDGQIHRHISSPHASPTFSTVQQVEEGGRGDARTPLVNPVCDPPRGSHDNPLIARPPSPHTHMQGTSTGARVPT